MNRLTRSDLVLSLPVRRLGASAALIAAALILYNSNPTSSPWFPKCPVHLLTGLHCPGCGSTRAAHAALHGNLGEALSKNALLVCGSPLALALWLWKRWRTGLPIAEWTTLLPAEWIWLLAFVVTAFGIIRNIPAYPWSLLAPH
jgi:hypothetical protein